MKVNMGTKKAEELIHDFQRKHYKGTSLYDVYKSVSSKKANSWRAIEKECERLNGWNLHITGASCDFYSCMYAFEHEDEETGELFVVLRKETHSNTYDLYIPYAEYERRIAV